MKKLMINSLVIIMLCVLMSCTPQKSEYNWGLKNGTSDSLKNVDLSSIPQGSHPGFAKAPPNHSGWYMDIKHWPPPEIVVVSFKAPDGKNYKIRKTTSLPNNFQGDILIVIKKGNKGYYIEIKTGKLDELSLG